MASKIDCRLYDKKVEMYFCYEGDDAGDFKDACHQILMMFITKRRQIEMRLAEADQSRVSIAETLISELKNGEVKTTADDLKQGLIGSE